VAVVIPTYGREQVLLDTVRACLDQKPPPGEIIVVDQTPRHEPRTEEFLRSWSESGQVRLIRRDKPSQPAAANCALLAAARPLVLFLDDDIVPAGDLVERHALAHGDTDVWAVVGQILQPGQEPVEYVPAAPDGRLRTHLDFRFNSSRRCRIENCMSGNVSVRREKALAVGGFDENFRYTVAYRFDTEFGRRICRHGGKILFEPTATLRHLRASRGGTRSASNHLTSAKPDHSIGDYYFAILYGRRMEVFSYAAQRLVRSVATRFHLRHPWWIPPKLIGELRGLIGAVGLAKHGQRLITESRLDDSQISATAVPGKSVP
jgi:GT2 family glycosyltransferase